MTAKRERVKFARFLRRKVKLTLPESVRVAKFYLRHYEGPTPEPLVETFEVLCPEGCCHGYVYRLQLKSSGVMFPLCRLHSEFCGCP